MKTYKGLITSLPENGIFVFGSNTQGRHGAGAAYIAKHWFGAKYGQARGRQGRSYGIVTKDLTKNKHPSVPTRKIKNEIAMLYIYALERPELEFYIAYTGKGPYLSGFTGEQLANMFDQPTIPPNIIFEEGFAKLMQ